MSHSKIKDAIALRSKKEVKKEESTPNLTADVKALFVKRFSQAKMDEFAQQANGRQLIYIKVDESLAVLRPPTAEDLGGYMMQIAENGMGKAAAYIFNELVLDCDLDLINDEDKWLSVFLKLSSLLEGKKGEFFRG
ncbi:hypothetical protein [Flavobacterium sp.]